MTWGMNGSIMSKQLGTGYDLVKEIRLINRSLICVRSVSSLTLHVRILLQITSCHYKSSITDCYEFSLFSSDLTLSRDRPSRSKQSKSSKIIWSRDMIHLWIIILMIVGLSTKWSTHQCEYCTQWYKIHSTHQDYHNSNCNANYTFYESPARVAHLEYLLYTIMVCRK